MNLSDILLPTQLQLALSKKTEAEALQEVASLLQKNAHIHYFSRWYNNLAEGNFFPIKLPQNHGVVICHGRSSELDEIIMAAGRSQEGIPFRTQQGEELSVNLLFIIGLPDRLNNDYLRLIGSIARACSTPDVFEDLLKAPTKEEFITLLTKISQD